MTQRPLSSVTLLALTMAPSLSRAQEDGHAHIRGEVRAEATGGTLAGAEVRLDSAVVTHSDSLGAFSLRVAPGSYLLEVRLIGYGPALARLDLTPGSAVDLDVRLPDRRVALDTVVITGRAPGSPKLEGFFLRRERWPGGQFFTREEIERRGAYRLSDFFRTVRNVDVVCPRGLICFLVPSRARVLPSFTPAHGNTCEMQYYLDGAPYHLGSNGIDFVRPHDVAAVEVYVGSSQVPVEFSGRDARCGVVVIWTRDGVAQNR